MSGFENNVINNANALIRAAMHSPNYNPGIAGWTINKDGSAEFNNLNLRGTFIGNNWIMNSDGLFFYNGTPALGNLIGVWATPSASGIDQYGNVYNPGMTLVATATATNVFDIQDTNGNTLLTIDNSGNISGAIGSFTDLNINGLNLFNDVLPEYPLGVISRGWVTTTSNWPSPQIGTSELAILELDFTIPAGRLYQLEVPSVTFIPTTSANTQMIQRFRYTTDGSVPTTSSAQLPNKSPGVIAVAVANSTLNLPTPYMESFLPFNASADQTYRVLLTAFISSGTFVYAQGSEQLEMRVIDWGNAALPNNGAAFGFGTSGGAAPQTYTKTYYPTETHSYYGSTATYGTGNNSKRNDNGTMWQGCPNGHAFYEGDQYSFARFNYTQIQNDIGAGVINWAKLRLTNLSSYYSSGMNVVLGWTSYTGTYGNTFIPGSGTNMNIDHYHINQGQTLQRTLNAPMLAVLKTTFTGMVIGTSASFTNGTDLNNFGSFYGYSASPTGATPQLQINYSK